MNKHLFLSFTLVLLLVSCNRSKDVVKSPTYEIPNKAGNIQKKETPTQILAITPTIKIIPEPTVINNSQTEIVTITPSPDTSTHNRCNNELNKDNTNIQQEFSGNIYSWDPYPFGYLLYDPNVGLMSVQELKPVRTNLPGPNLGFAVAFSAYSQKIAYLVTNSDGFIELWIADLDLCHVERIWEDIEQWIGDASEYPLESHAHITWGPSDNSLIITSHDKDSHIAVYSFPNEALNLWSGECNQIILNTNSKQWTTVCSLNDEENFNYAILEVDGSIRLLSTLDDNPITIIDWAFSPDQHQVVFSTQYYSLFLADSNGEIMQLPISWDENIVNSFHMDYRRGLQWSLDGANILVFGYEASGEYCPIGISLVTGESYEQPCWFLLDAQSSEIVWWLKREQIEQYFPWEGLYTDYEAALSPDNKWIAMFYMHAPICEALIVSLESGRIKEIGNFVHTKIHWGKE